MNQRFPLLCLRTSILHEEAFIRTLVIACLKPNTSLCRPLPTSP